LRIVDARTDQLRRPSQPDSCATLAVGDTNGSQLSSRYSLSRSRSSHATCAIFRAIIFLPVIAGPRSHPAAPSAAQADARRRQARTDAAGWDLARACRETETATARATQPYVRRAVAAQFLVTMSVQLRSTTGLSLVVRPAAFFSILRASKGRHGSASWSRIFEKSITLHLGIFTGRSTSIYSMALTLCRINMMGRSSFSPH